MSDIRVSVTGPAPFTVKVTGATGVSPVITNGQTFAVQLAGVGPTGPRGDVGVTGPRGLPGESGAVGPTGAASSVAGPTGSTGASGQSITGPTGAAGVGVTGATGATGARGSDGAAGESVTGPTGAAGAASTVTGPTGAAGATGSAASATTDASAIVSGTLADARLSSAIATYATLAATDNQPASGLDVYPRGEATSGASAGNSGQIFFIFFTPSVSLTVSSITFCSGTIAGAGLTLARMGLYTFDETNVALVARTASDTTLFTATNTAYTRSFATAGGYPATYDLVAGTRYGAAVIVVGTTASNFAGRTIQVAVGGQTPRMAASLPSQTDLITSGTVNNAQANLYARLT